MTTAAHPSTTATKPGLQRGQFRRIAEGGFGDGGNSYPHAMCWYEDRLYVGTTRHVLALLYNRFDDIKQWTPFPVVPAKTNPFREFDTRAQIWRYEPGANKWEKVLTSPMSDQKTDQGDPLPIFAGVRNMIAFQRKGDSKPLLHAMTWSARGGPGPLVYRSEDGVNFKRLEMLGFHASQFSTFRPLVKFRDRLFTAPTGKPGSANAAGVAIVLENADPENDPWVMANEESFGDPLNQTIFEMCVFNDHLYAGTLNPKGFQLWKTDAEGKPPYKWKPVIIDGAGRGPHNEAIGSMSVFNGSLYVGTAINNGGYDRVYGIGPAGVEILRVNADDTWELMMGEGRLTTAGWKLPASGHGPGFDRLFNTYLWRQCVHDGWLYAGTFCLNWLLKFIPRDKWPEDKKRMMDDERTTLVADRLGGFELWRTRDGEIWTPVTRTGFGNSWNYGIRTMVSTPVGLFVGTANPFGPQVAVKRAAGWTYEPNPRGGLEVWLGSDQPGPRQTEIGHPAAYEGLYPAPVEVDAGALRLEEENFVENAIHAFYERTDWRAFGYWDATILKATEACRNLVRELATWVENKKGDVLMLTGSGQASVEYAQQFFEKGRVVAHVLGGAAKAIPRSGFDTAFSVEGLCRSVLADGVAGVRAALKPGGVLVGAEILTGHESTAIAELTRALEKEGFKDVRVSDVTGTTWKMLRQHLSLYLWEKVLDSEVDDDLIKQIEARLFGGFEPVAAYVLFKATRV